MIRIAISKRKPWRAKLASRGRGPFAGLSDAAVESQRKRGQVQVKIHSKPHGIPNAQVVAAPGQTEQGSNQVTVFVSQIDVSRCRSRSSSVRARIARLSRPASDESVAVRGSEPQERGVTMIRVIDTQANGPSARLSRSASETGQDAAVSRNERQPPP
jgi:hypothetical protein